MVNQFKCDVAPTDILTVRPTASGRRVRVSIHNSIGGSPRSVMLAPEDALRFAKAILDVADEVAEAETS